MNQGCTYSDRISRTWSGTTVLDYYCRRYQHSDAGVWRSRLESGEVLLNGDRVLAQTPLEFGQILTYHRPPWEEPEAPLAFDVLYEDHDLMVVEKPSGLPVLPGAGFLENTLLGQLRKHYKSGDPENAPVPIHRLGRGTSGLVLLARSPRAKKQLSQQMRDRQMHKQYLALASGVMTAQRFAIEQPIGKVPHPALGYLYSACEGGLYSRSEVQVIERREDCTLAAVTILTGRPHQIRIHLAWSGFPLVGDPLYDLGAVVKLGAFESGGDVVPVPGDCGYLLHAYRLGFVHPGSGEAVVFVCPPPEGLRSPVLYRLPALG